MLKGDCKDKTLLSDMLLIVYGSELKMGYFIC